MNNYRSFSIPCSGIEIYELETAKAKHLKKLSQISCSPSNRIDNVPPINYTECRKPGKKFRLNGNSY